MTPAERKREERKRKREQGLVLKQCWTKPEYWPEILKLIKKINK